MWALSSLLIESETSTAFKNYSSILEIKQSCFLRNVVCLLTQKNITFLQCSLRSDTKDFEVISKVEFEYACCLTNSLSNVYVGDFAGCIEILEISAKDPSKAEDLQFRLKEPT